MDQLVGIGGVLLVSLLVPAAMVLALGLWLRHLWVQDRSLLSARLDELYRLQQRTEQILQEQLSRGREESTLLARQLREEVATAIQASSTSVRTGVAEIAQVQATHLTGLAEQLSRLTVSNAEKLDRVRETVDARLELLQAENARRLEELRQTVDEKLQGTLETKLGESFRLVSERLEQVHRGLGEMQTLAAGVGDLKRVLANVKTRGTFGEVQLQQLLDQVLTPDQYATNIATREGSSERVEFAIRLPGRAPDGSGAVWLPIDAKFPLEDYERLVSAADSGDSVAVDAATHALEARVRQFARDIRDKYLDPPHTTDFGILFLPTEGLYAELLRRPGLADAIQRDCRVVLSGPTTLWALLNSLQMGFRTLAIEQRSAEVWALLGAVKTDFAKFGDTLDAIERKLGEAANRVAVARRDTRRIERRLKDVEVLPLAAAEAAIGTLPATESEEAEDDGP